MGAEDNKKVYRFELRFQDTIEQVGGRLIDNYAVTDDGSEILRYNSADDEWIVQEW